MKRIDSVTGLITLPAKVASAVAGRAVGVATEGVRTGARVAGWAVEQVRGSDARQRPSWPGADVPDVPHVSREAQPAPVKDEDEVEEAAPDATAPEVSPVEVAPTPKPRPKPGPPATKAAAKKTPAKAAPAKKAPAKKAAVSKGPGAKLPAKKAPAKKAPSARAATLGPALSAAELESLEDAERTS